MNRLVVCLGLVALCVLNGSAQPSFTLTGGEVPFGGEYFFDRDPGSGNGNPLSFEGEVGSQLSRFSPDLSGLGYGNHRLFVRLRNEAGEWTMERQHDFMLTREAVQRPPGIAGLTYSFDSSDTQISLDIPDAPEEPWRASLALDTRGLAAGSHRAYFHLEDSTGVRGLPHVLPFYLSERAGTASLVWSVHAGETRVSQGTVTVEEQEDGVAIVSWLVDPIATATEDKLDLKIGIARAGARSSETLGLAFSVEPSLFLAGIELALEGSDLVLRFAAPLRRSAVVEQSMDLHEWGKLLELSVGQELARIPATEENQFFRVRQILE